MKSLIIFWSIWILGFITAYISVKHDHLHPIVNPYVGYMVPQWTEEERLWTVFRSCGSWLTVAIIEIPRLMHIISPIGDKEIYNP